MHALEIKRSFYSQLDQADLQDRAARVDQEDPANNQKQAHEHRETTITAVIRGETALLDPDRYHQR